MTTGQKRVGVNFNPSGEEIVDQIKAKSAELIDLCESMKTIALAQTNFEIASMFAVKANFAE